MLYLNKWLQTPVRLTAVYLAGLYLLAWWFSEETVWVNELLRAAGLVLGAGAAYLAAERLGRYPKSPLTNLVISGLILLLLTDQTAAFWQMLGLGVVLVSLKLIFRSLQGPVFNPAAMSLWVMNWFSLPVSWWGVGFDPRWEVTQTSLAVVLSLPLGIYLAYKYRKLVIIYAALAVFTTVYFVLLGSWPITTLMEGTLIFYLTIMVCEPKTSPTDAKQKLVYGGLLGGLLALSLVKGWFSTPFIVSLLISNGVINVYRYQQLRMKQATLLA